ncbi:PRC-barrel domain-containing protein [Bacillus sp. FJAT-45037]|uniref:PRC-barrel domain-containing protein n=1 Tax=Bacillus sp. FJAT-45037 TaxID=2011007 RepID=UPI000C247A41|nr:PRC-barrel domain-containing protein [Bacillus sp. FJAT-45037]
MKKSIEVTGLPLISIQDGQTIGKIKTLIINPDEKSVDFLTVENENWQISMKAVPFKKVIGVGDYAVTIEHENHIIDLAEMPIANNLANNNIRLIGNKVMTRKGQFLGEVQEYYLDEDSGKLKQIELADSQIQYDAEFMITIGKEMVIVHEDCTKEQNDKDNDTMGLNEQDPASKQSDEEIIKKRQADLLTGKTVTTTIYSEEGELLAEEGTVLTVEEVNQIRAKSRSAFVQLSMNVK